MEGHEYAQELGDGNAVGHDADVSEITRSVLLSWRFLAKRFDARKDELTHGLGDPGIDLSRHSP